MVKLPARKGKKQKLVWRSAGDQGFGELYVFFAQLHGPEIDVCWFQIPDITFWKCYGMLHTLETLG